MTNARSAIRFGQAVAAIALMACAAAAPGEAQTTKTPIKHVIVMFQENISFVLRPLFRHLSQCAQSARRAALPGSAGHADRQRSDRGAADRQSQQGQSLSPAA